MKTKNLKHFQKKLIRQYMSFLQNSEEFQNTKRERDSKFSSKEMKLPKLNSNPAPQRSPQTDRRSSMLNTNSNKNVPRENKIVQKIDHRENRELRENQKEIKALKLEDKHNRLSNKLEDLKEQKRDAVRQYNEDKQKIKAKLNDLDAKRNITKLLKKQKQLEKHNVNFYEEPLFHSGIYETNSVILNQPTVYQTGGIVRTRPDFVLREMPLDSEHNLNYYYPYFYKTQILRSYNSLNYSSLKTNCLDFNCRWCSSLTNICQECQNGYFLYNDKCLTTCEIGLVANNYRRTCVPMRTTSKNI